MYNKRWYDVDPIVSSAMAMYKDTTDEKKTQIANYIIIRVKDFGITKREQEIIVALLHGKSNKELAETLFVSEKTIETHLANIYRKVGVKNRLELFSRLQND